MAVNKFQRSRLTFDLSAKVAHILVPSTYLNIVFSETTRPIEIKIHMTTPYDWLAKIVQIVMVTLLRWPPSPYMVKTI